MTQEVWSTAVDVGVVGGLVVVTIALWSLALRTVRHRDGRPVATDLRRPGVMALAGFLVVGISALVAVHTRVTPVFGWQMGLIAPAVVVVPQLLAGRAVPSARVAVAAAGMLVLTGLLLAARLGHPTSWMVGALTLAAFALCSRPGVLRLLTEARYRHWIGLAGLVCIAAPLMIGAPVADGAHVNITLPGLGSVQPQEVGRVLLIVWLAGSLGAHRLDLVAEDRRWRRLPVPGLQLVGVAVLPALLGVAVGAASSDFGPALVLAITTCTMLVVAGARQRYLVVASAAGTLGFVAAATFVTKVSARVSRLSHPVPTDGSPLDQLAYGLVSVARGGLTGLGIGRGWPENIPAVTSDYLLVGLAEEVGALAIVCVLALMLLIFRVALDRARRVSHPAHQLLAVGLGVHLVVQAVLVAGGVLAALPLTGLPVPFLSTSGSSLVASTAAMGLLVGLATSTSESTAAPPAVRRRITIVGLAGVVLVSLLAGSAARTGLDENTLHQVTAVDPFAARLDVLDRGRLLTRDGVVLAETAPRVPGSALRVDSAIRHYPHGARYAAVTGHIRVDGADTALESALAEELRCPEARSLAGGGCPEVHLSIESSVQTAADDALAGRRGAVIAIDPRTGEILAYVSRPSADPNLWGDPARRSPDSDRTDDDLVRRATFPGSVAKLATALGAPRAYSEASKIAIEGPVIASPEPSCGDQSLSTALALSCNPEFARVGLLLGSDMLAASTEQLLTQQTHLHGLAVDISQLTQEGDSAYVAAAGAIGLGSAQVTPFSVAQLTTTIARDGDTVDLSLLPIASGSPGRTTRAAASRALDLDRSALADVQAGMRRAVESGTASSVPGMRDLGAAAKTGSADYSVDDVNAWITAYAPHDDPRCTVTVMITGGPELSGSRDAGPVATSVLQACLVREPQS